MREFGAKTSAWNGSPCWRMLPRSPGFLLATSQTRPVPSRLEEAIRQRSGENASPIMPPRCPLRLAICLAWLAELAGPPAVLGVSIGHDLETVRSPPGRTPRAGPALPVELWER